MNNYFITATHIMAYLASAQKTQTLTSSETIALRIHTNASIVRKITAILVEKEFVRTVRGFKGGYVLASKAESISLKDVFLAVEELNPDFWGLNKMSVLAKRPDSYIAQTQDGLETKLAKAKEDMLQSLSLVSIAEI